MVRVFIYHDCVQTQHAADENEVENARYYFYWAMQGLSFSLIWFIGILCIAAVSAIIIILVLYLSVS